MRFSYEDADKYGAQASGGSYFKLENDMDVAKVRLLGNDINDFPGYACHEVKVGRDEKRRLVNCLREYNDPVDVCPLCKARYKVVAKVFIPLYNIDQDEMQMWERGKKFYSVLSGYATRHKNLVSWVTEIERHGKPKSTDTTYQLYDVEQDDTTLEDFEDIPEVLGRYILDKSAEDMEYFLDTGEFPETGGDDKDEAPVRRRESRDDGERRSSRSRSRRSSEEEF